MTSTAFDKTHRDVRITESGFTVFHDGQVREFQDSDVVGLEIDRHRSADSRTTVERLRLRVEEANGTPIFEVESQYTGPDDDVAAAFRERVLEALLQRTMETLHRGDEFDAGPWSISLEGIQDNATGQRIPIEEIEFAQWQDGHFCIGRESDQKIRLAGHAENTHLLPWVLKYLLPEGTAPQSLPLSATGRTLAEFHDTPFGVAMAVGIFAGLGIALAVGLLKFSQLDAMVAYGILGGVLLVMFAALGVVHLMYGKAVSLRHLDNALVRVHGEKEQIIPLDRLAGFSACWTDVYVNSVYSGTTVRFAFEPDSIEFPSIVHHSDAKHGQPKYDELQLFQARLSATVAERMKQELAQSGRVLWTPRLSILPHGLEFRKNAAAEPTFYDFAQISRCQVEQGELKVAVDGNKRPTIVEKCDQMNFFPGLALVQCLVRGEGSNPQHSLAARS